MANQQINLVLGGFGSGIGQVNALANAMNRLAGAQQRLANSARGRAGRGSGGSPSAGGSPSSSGGRGAAAQRLAMSYLGANLAHMGQTAAHGVDLSSPGNFGRSLVDAGTGMAKGTVGLGAAVVSILQPELAPIAMLVSSTFNQLADAAGSLAKSFIATAEQLARNVTDAAQRLADFGRARIMSGGSTRDIAALRAFGVSPGEIPGAASGLRSRLTSDPLAMMAARQMGVGPVLPRGLGQTNEAQLLNRLLQGLYNTRQRFGEGAALLQAQRLGLESHLPGMNVSPYVRAAQARDASLGIRINDAQGVTRANDFNAALARIGANFELLSNAANKGAFVPITRGLIAVGDAIGRLAAFVNEHPQIAAFFGRLVEGGLKLAAGLIDSVTNGLTWLDKLGQGWIAFLTGAWKFLQGLAGRVGLHLPDLPQTSGAAGKDPRQNATDANTAALNANTAALRQAGAYGGGERLRSTIPDSVHHELLKRGMAGNTMRLGGVL